MGGPVSQYLAMGGHAVFIWSAYAVAAVVLIGLLGLSWRGLKAREAELALLEPIRGREGHRRGRKDEGSGS
jgi:heme exporter protein D